VHSERYEVVDEGEDPVVYVESEEDEAEPEAEPEAEDTTGGYFSNFSSWLNKYK